MKTYAQARIFFKIVGKVELFWKTIHIISNYLKLLENALHKLAC